MGGRSVSLMDELMCVSYELWNNFLCSISVSQSRLSQTNAQQVSNVSICLSTKKASTVQSCIEQPFSFGLPKRTHACYVAALLLLAMNGDARWCQIVCIHSSSIGTLRGVFADRFSGGETRNPIHADPTVGRTVGSFSHSMTTSSWRLHV